MELDGRAKRGGRTESTGMGPTLPKGRKELSISHHWVSCCRAGVVLFAVPYSLAVSPLPEVL